MVRCKVMKGRTKVVRRNGRISGVYNKGKLHTAKSNYSKPYQRKLKSCVRFKGRKRKYYSL